MISNLKEKLHLQCIIMVINQRYVKGFHKKKYMYLALLGYSKQGN